MIPFPDKTYDIIYADPAWECPDDMNPTHGGQAPYSYMNLSDIQGLPVSDITADNALLFLWIRSPMLEEGIETGKAWGFKYITVGFVWDKHDNTAGNYTLPQTELCLVFKHGKIPQPRGKRNVRQFLSCKRGRHSEKPKEIRHRITEMFPTQAKIELFARPDWTDYGMGWDFWGNEVVDTNP